MPVWLKLRNLDLLLSLHFETNSECLFSNFLTSAWNICNFSDKHKLHVFKPDWYGIAWCTIFHLICGNCPDCFNFQMAFACLVELIFLMSLKDWLWLLYQSLNVVSQLQQLQQLHNIQHSLSIVSSMPEQSR